MFNEGLFNEKDFINYNADLNSAPLLARRHRKDRIIFQQIGDRVQEKQHALRRNSSSLVTYANTAVTS